MKTTREQGDETRAKIIEAVVGYMLAYGYPPSYREIGERVGLKSSSTVQHQLDKLVDMGLITREPGKDRAISVIGVPYKDERGPK